MNVETIPNHHRHHGGFAGVRGLLCAALFRVRHANRSTRAGRLTGAGPADVVVDIGCGSGATAHHAATLGATVVGVDPAPVLRSDHPASLHSFVRMFAQPIHWQTAGELMHSVQTGQAAAGRAFPDGGLWGYLAANPTDRETFGQAMAAKSTAQIADILAAHDFSRYQRVVDVGGGEGHLLRAIIDKHVGVDGVVFDLPSVIEAARAAGANERLEFVPGDFFESPLPSGDAMILMEVLHDWDDAHCAQILSAVRRAAHADTKLLVIEIEMTDGRGPDWAKLLDIVMLGCFAARQRTNDEYQRLLTTNGFAVTHQTSTPAGMTIIEAVAAQ